MRHLLLFAACLAPVVDALAAAAAAALPLPAVRLQVEVRVVDEAAASGHGDYTVSTRALARPPVPALQLQLLNGQTGAVRLGRTLPVQWLQGAARGAAPAAAASSSADRAGAVAYGLTWVASGQSLQVRPQWAGGSSPVTLDLQFSSTALQASPGSSGPAGTALPALRTQQATTTLQVPLGVWTAFAATGTVQAAAEPGHLSTVSLAEQGRQLMQVRVTLP